MDKEKEGGEESKRGLATDNFRQISHKPTVLKKSNLR